MCVVGECVVWCGAWTRGLEFMGLPYFAPEHILSTGNHTNDGEWLVYFHFQVRVAMLVIVCSPFILMLCWPSIHQLYSEKYSTLTETVTLSIKDSESHN